jgi:hypothetical protein
MVDELLAFYSDEAKVSNESDDLQNSIKLTRDNIKAIIMVCMDTILILFFHSFAQIINNWFICLENIQDNNK